MKSYLILAGSIACLSCAYATPTRVIQERDRQAIPSGLVLPRQAATPEPSGQDGFTDSPLWDIQNQGPHPSGSVPMAYTPGTCAFDLKESWTCRSAGENLFAVIDMKDADFKVIGGTDVSHNADGAGINDGASYSFNSVLPYPLVVTGEHEKDYIQFTYGSLSWTSTVSTDGASCQVKEWSPAGGPVCQSSDKSFTVLPATKQMTCSFPC